MAPQLIPQYPTGVLAIFERIFVICGIKPILRTVVEHPTNLALIAADGRRNPSNEIIWYTTGGVQD